MAQWGVGTDGVSSKAPTPEDRVRPPSEWSCRPPSPPVAPLSWEAEGAEKEIGLVPKLQSA